MLRVFVFANTFFVRGNLRIPIVTLNSLGTCSLTGCPHWILSFIFWSVHVLPTIICVGIVKNSVQWNKTDEITWILGSVGHEFTQVKCKRCVFKWTQCCYEKFFIMSDTQGAIWEESLVVGGFYCRSAGQAINIIMSPRGVAIYSILFFSVLYGWLCNNRHWLTTTYVWVGVGGWASGNNNHQTHGSRSKWVQP